MVPGKRSAGLAAFLLSILATLLLAALVLLRLNLFPTDIFRGEKIQEIVEEPYPIPEHTQRHRQLAPSLTPRIALVIDDLGNRWENEPVQGLLELDVPVTFGIIPGLKYSKRLAEAAHEAGDEVIVHLPMQPIAGEVGLGIPVLRPGMDVGEMNHTLWFSTRIPYAVGLNNHMGSAATQDTTLMRWLAGECGRRGWFLLDSITHAHSVLYAQARALGVPAVRRDIFLDHNRGEESVTAALLQAERLARSLERPVIVIGHPRPDTWAVLERELPNLRARGVRFVPLTNAVEGS